MYKQAAESRQKEEYNMRHILVNNKYDAPCIGEFNNKKRQRQFEQEQKQKWTKFTYIGKETRFITELLRNTNVKIAFATDDTMHNA